MFHPYKMEEVMEHTVQVEKKNPIINEKCVVQPRRLYSKAQSSPNYFTYHTHTNLVTVITHPTTPNQITSLIAQPTLA